MRIIVQESITRPSIADINNYKELTLSTARAHCRQDNIKLNSGAL